MKETDMILQMAQENNGTITTAMVTEDRLADYGGHSGACHTVRQYPHQNIIQ